MPDTIDAARGRWREVFAALGVPEGYLTGKHGPCPLCGGKDRFRFTDRSGDGDYFCNNCGAGKGIQLLVKYKGWTFPEAAREVDKIIGNLPKPKPPKPKRVLTIEEMRELYTKGSPISDGDPVSIYLRGRNITGPWSMWMPFYVPEVFHRPTNTWCCAMLAAFRDVDGMPTGLHYTYLRRDGSKVEGGRCRMFAPGSALPAGGAIRLENAAETMGIAEGIETALSASRLYDMPVWATTSVVRLSCWRPPIIVKRVVIFGDNDESFVGQSAAYALAARLRRENQSLQVEVKIPEVPGTDWNDVLVKQVRDAA
jgi:putative DNA primase/helicase